MASGSGNQGSTSFDGYVFTCFILYVCHNCIIIYMQDMVGVTFLIMNPILKKGVQVYFLFGPLS